MGTERRAAVVEREKDGRVRQVQNSLIVPPCSIVTAEGQSHPSRAALQCQVKRLRLTSYRLSFFSRPDSRKRPQVDTHRRHTVLHRSMHAYTNHHATLSHTLLFLFLTHSATTIQHHCQIYQMALKSLTQSSSTALTTHLHSQIFAIASYLCISPSMS